MKKRSFVLFTSVAILACMLAFENTYSQEEVLEDSAFEDRTRPPAVFSHEEHNEKAEIEECYVCHHLYEDGNKVEDDSSEGQGCSECHRVEEEHSAGALMKAYHSLCTDCHRDKNKGPVTCGECHLRSNN